MFVKFGKLGIGFAMLMGIAGASAAAGAAGLAQDVCAACHGANGISVSDGVPNLAGQRSKYLENQLKAFRGGDRSHAIMNAVAEQLSDEEITSVAAFFASLPGGTGDATSDLPEDINHSALSFPEGYQDSFTYYTTIDFPKKKQTRRYYANPVAVVAAKKGEAMPAGAYILVEAYKAKLDANGEPVEGADGHYETEALAFYTAMATDDGWGDKIPDLLRNRNWNYAVFTTDKVQKAGVNQAVCLACHKPLADDSYVFTLGTLQDSLK